MRPVFPGAPPFFRAACGVVGAFARLTKGVRVTGLEHLPPSGPVIVAGNHVSMIDPALVGWSVGRVRLPNFLAKEELFRLAPSAWMFRQLGCIPLDRSKGDLRALRVALGVLKDGGCLVLFPEGTRSRDGRPRRPKAGVAMLARMAGVPVLPVRLVSTESATAGPRPFEVRFGRPLTAPVPPDPRGGDQAFAEAVMAAVFAL